MHAFFCDVSKWWSILYCCRLPFFEVHLRFPRCTSALKLISWQLAVNSFQSAVNAEDTKLYGVQVSSHRGKGLQQQKAKKNCKVASRDRVLQHKVASHRGKVLQHKVANHRGKALQHKVASHRGKTSQPKVASHRGKVLQQNVACHIWAKTKLCSTIHIGAKF